MQRDIFKSEFKEEPYWWDLARPFSSVASLPARSDLVIVGAGLCGLSAALRALELGVRPLVLDVGFIGGEASSRSGAMVSSGQKFLISGAAQSLGSEIVNELINVHADAFRYVRTLATKGGVEGQFRTSGRLFLAAVPEHFQRFAQHAEILNEIAQVTARTVCKQDLRSELASQRYYGGLLVEEFGGLHPSLFACNLAREVQRKGAELRSHTRVLAVKARGSEFIVETDAGSVRAGQVLFATNGYTDNAMRLVRRRIAPVGSFMIATEELGTDQVAAAMPGLRMYSDTKRNLWFFRPSPDGKRILFGGRPGILPRAPRQAAIKLHQYMSLVFPSLHDVKITHAWTGTIAMTRRQVQHIGQRKGIWFAVGCNGSGVAIMPWVGRLAVERMLGTRTESTVFERIAFDVMPTIEGKPWFVPFAAGWFGLNDWIDRMRHA